MSDRRAAIDEKAFDAIPRVRKEHLRDHAKQWVRSVRRDPERPDEKGAVAVLVLIGGDRLAFYEDQGDLLRVKELDR